MHVQHHLSFRTACRPSIAYAAKLGSRELGNLSGSSYGVRIMSGSSIGQPSVSPSRIQANPNYVGIHHIGVLCKDIEGSMKFYQDILGMEVNAARPNDKLPYKGAWLWVGEEMIHLMELPNPDPADGRPEHGGRDRHLCLSVKSIEPLEKILQQNQIPFTKSKSGRAAIFFRDPDQNVLEMAEQ